jgi:hypothetical protein
MMNLLKNILIAWVYFASTVFGVEALVIPDGQIGGYINVDELQWNRYTTKNNFVILSIDDNQGKWLSENLDGLRSSYLAKWGFDDFKSTAEVRIFCVPNQNLLKKLFSIDKPRIEKRENLVVMWLVLGDNLSSDLASYLQEAIIYDYEITSKKELPFWFKRGIIVLANDSGHVNDQLKNLKKSLDEKKTFSVDRVFKMEAEAFDKDAQDLKDMYDQQAAALCLMLRKEFGGLKLKGFLESCSNQGVEKSLHAIYNFNGVNHFGNQYQHYLRDICSQAVEDKIAASYLEIKPF